MQEAILQSVITCPLCGKVKEETMPVDACQFFLRMHGVPYRAASKVGRLLRVLFVWYHTVPAGSIAPGLL